MPKSERDVKKPRADGYSWNLGPVYCQGTAFEPLAAAYVNSWPRVVRAINWADKYGLGILVNLHGAPRSQNGASASIHTLRFADGSQDKHTLGYPMASKTSSAILPTSQLTMNVLTYLTQQLVKVNNVVGIEILNELSSVDSLPAFCECSLRQ